MKALDTQALHKMLGSPFAMSLAFMMNAKEKSLLDMARYNLTMACGAPDSDKFIREMLLPHFENNVAPELPVHSNGGRYETARVLDDLLCNYEETTGVTMNSDEVASAMKYVFLFLAAVCHLRNPSLAAGLGIRKIGLFKPRWEYNA